VENVPGLAGVSGSGYLAELHFHVLGLDGESSDIDLSNGVLGNNQAQAIPASWFGDSVTVSLPDVTAPWVSSTLPNNNDTGVPVNTTIEATFSEAMNIALAEVAFSILPAVTGSFSWSGNTMIFTPAVNLNSNTIYTMTINTAAEDIVGNPLAAAYIWHFTTAKALPAVTTRAANNIASTSATLNGRLDSLGDYSPVHVSFLWGTTSGDLTEETDPVEKTSTGAFSADLSSLTPNTPYYFQTKVTGSVTVLGDELSFTTTLIDVMRDLPAMVGVGTTFDVTITFAAPADNFNSIGLVDSAPAGWGVQVDAAWCSPAVFYANLVGSQAQYMWAGPPLVGYSENQAFTAVYKVTVPGDAAAGISTFPGGELGYKIGSTSYPHVAVTGDSTIEVVVTAPTVITKAATNITTNSATVSGNLTSLGDYTEVSVSFLWGTTSGALDHETDPVVKTSTVGFSAALSSLTANTKYYFRAKVTGSVTVLGDEHNFTTLNPPTVTTNAATNILDTTATLNGRLVSLGSASSANVSFEWGLDTTYSFNTTAQIKNSAPVDFNANITGLKASTTYHFRAKAVGHDTSYGDDVTFKTSTVPPTVTTDNATSVTSD